MIDHQATTGAVTPPMPECWRRIGVAGDRSCPELEAVIHCRNCPVLADAARTFFERAAPEGYLEAWRAILEEPAEAVGGDTASVLVFRVADEWLALPTAVLVEVAAPRTIHRLPHRTAGVLAGIVNVRGQLQLCASLHGLLGLNAEPMTAAATSSPLTAGGTTARLLVVEPPQTTGADRWVFRVDEVAGVQRVARSGLRPVPATVGHAGGRLTSALFAWQDRTVALLDETRLFETLRDRMTA